MLVSRVYTRRYIEVVLRSNPERLFLINFYKLICAVKDRMLKISDSLLQNVCSCDFCYITFVEKVWFSDVCASLYVILCLY